LATIVEAAPHEALAVEAAYWSAETYLLEGHYERAAKAFASSYATYGASSPRAPDSLVKMAEAFNGLGDAERACAALDRLRAQHGADLAPWLANAARNEARRARCR
jgi:TolA-binding protein